MALSDRPFDEGLEIISLYCSGCGRRRTGKKLKAALNNCRLMCPKNPEGQGCGREMVHHLTLDPEKCPCHRLKARLHLTEAEMASLFSEKVDG